MPAYDPFDAEVIRDPYPAYARLREEAPVHHVERLDVYVLTRYRDVVAALRDPATFSSAGGMGLLLGGGPPGPFKEFMRARNPGMGGMSLDDIAGMRFLIASDPPDHTRMRRLANKGFTPKEIARLERRVRTLCEELVDALIARSRSSGGADLVADLAFPLPVIVIAEMLGIPAERRDDFRRWSNDMVGSLSGAMDMERAAQSSMEMFQFFTEIIEARTANPGADLISQLIVGSENEALSSMELVMLCVLLLIAGNETTTNLIGNLQLALFERPQLWEQMRTDPAFIPRVVEEGLRYDGPVQALFRSTTRPVELHGTRIPEGKPVMVSFAAANRDGQHYPEPDRFDPSRNAADHLAFGAGIHLCLGAPLARLEARVAYEVLTQRLARLEPAGPIERVESFLLRGLKRMPVSAVTA